MNEIEKMYGNANIKAKEYCDRDSDACMSCCPEWENRQDCWKYKSVIPPFTAEKQLELIKWFIHSRHFSPVRFNARWVVDDIASHINFLWQSLTEEEKQQVKEILK